MSVGREVELFGNGRNQAVRIPRAFELPGEVAIMRREGDTLVIERPPAGRPNAKLVPFLATMTPFPISTIWRRVRSIFKRFHVGQEYGVGPPEVSGRRGGRRHIHQRHRRGGVAVWGRQEGVGAIERLHRRSAAVIDIEPLAPPADAIYGRLRADLERGASP